MPNRDVLLDRLRLSIARLDRHAGLACVLYFDLDNIKGINDEFGHAVGDAVLHEFALRLRRAMRPTDTVARFGGDEFVAVCDDLKSTAEAELLTGRIVQTLTGE